ncbi:5'-nucleotidase, lipoprotein e(P4) family [Mucilaginibacter limnophilus]|uniref:5'-nucleotidase, lipoprotein e(P4) family n=1 Tax=Mucilaginibacter limnophilus TaxID=1932778 RepID=A0A437MRD7_9SPHI|nr:5'-nucleotidase, lipoprotein e(P4) family [Mucilaginibacter limnophilus]RVU00221.1 5'-nucleotidase, lipoprotein e(P4) family [Mucilaginibacter limnophilus]
MTKTLKIFLFTICCATYISCTTVQKTTTLSIANNGKVWASLWQQRAAEYKALCLQAYITAHLRLGEALKQPSALPMAIVTDIDETVLDNSPYDALRGINNQEYDIATWKAWTAKAIADTVPGAPSFFKYAASKGVTIFYITNRDEDERTATLKNLQLYNMPNVDDAHLLMRQSSSSKESRRQQVLKNYNIILLCGDNLADFDSLYDNHPTTEARDNATAKLSPLFGKRYIVLPNVSYGDWENAFFKYNYKLKPAQKDSVIRSLVKTPR